MSQFYWTIWYCGQFWVVILVCHTAGNNASPYHAVGSTVLLTTQEGIDGLRQKWHNSIKEVASLFTWLSLFMLSLCYYLCLCYHSVITSVYVITLLLPLFMLSLCYYLCLCYHSHGKFELSILVLTTRCITVTSQERHGVSNHWQIDCLFNRLFRLIVKKTAKLCVTNPSWGESTVHRRIPHNATGPAICKVFPRLDVIIY